VAFQRNHGFTVRVARYHNIFGPEGAWNNGKEKSPAALARKVAMAPEGGSIEIWGDGLQTRSFLYIDECLEGTVRAETRHGDVRQCGLTKKSSTLKRGNWHSAALISPWPRLKNRSHEAA
jgi:nucleoside-diphosphate-sugar epimerase